MKRLAIIFVLLSSPAWASIAYVSASHTVCILTTAGTTQTCTLTAATTAGNTVVVGLSFKTTTRTLTSVVGSAATSHFYQYTPITCNGSSICIVQAICVNCPALTTVKPTFSGTTVFVTTVEEYSGVGSIGIFGVATGSSTNPSVSVTTSDANNWVVAATANLGSTGIPTHGTGAVGNLRDANRTGTSSSHAAGAANDNTAASPGAVANTVTITSGVWAAVGTELRSVAAPQSYIWPNCDSTHPCVIYHFTTVASGTAFGETLQDLKIYVEPSKANNLLAMAVTHPSAKTLSTPTDDKSNTWVQGPTTTDAGAAVTSEIYYKCGAATGTSALALHFSSALASGDTGQISYTEVSGIATSSCIDGTATGSNALAPASTIPIQPGSITTTQANSLVYNYAQATWQKPQDNPAVSWAVPDGAESLLSSNLYDKTISAIQVKAAAGAVNPALYIVEPTSFENWNDLAIAFKASSGAGTQPSGIHAVRTVSFWCCGASTVSIPFPSSGNAFVLASGQDANTGDWPISSVSNGYNTVQQVTGGSAITTDPQAFYICSATTGGQTWLTWTQGNQAHFTFYDIAGARTSATCFDTNTFTTGTQSGTSDITVTNAITPTTSNGLVIGVAYYGTGPESSMSAPSGVVMDNIWATGMSDTDAYSYGDGHLHYYNPGTGALTFTIQMSNGAGGTFWDWLFMSFKAPAAASGVRKRVIVTSE